jgi:putative transposase
LAFGVEIDKDVVRRILSAHYRPESDSAGPSWLTFLGHTKDSLWSCDLFRCESATLRTHWVLVVMDQFTRRIIGFGVHCGAVDGVALCRMFHRAIRGKSLPKYLSSDHDPLYRFHHRQANLRVLEVTEIKTVPFERSHCTLRKADSRGAASSSEGRGGARFLNKGEGASQGGTVMIWHLAAKRGAPRL